MFVLLIGGAYVLYDRLGQDVTAEQMIVHATPQPTPEPAAEEVIPEGESTEAADTSANEEPEDIIAPDFEVIDKEGNPVKLSSFFGKPIVLNFWASWCGPCRAEMPNVVSLYEKYHKKGLEIVGISFDEDETAWKNAVKTMHMTWPQASELRSWDNIMTQKYSVTSIPYTILIDSNGTIIGQQLRGEELENTVKQYLE